MKLLCLFVFSTIAFAVSGQGLYTPRDVQRAYDKGTRSYDGNPGKNYWQNKARYTITITAAPPDRTVRGEETIFYTNNSPDTLRNPTIKLFLNIHKPGAPRNSPASAQYITAGMTVDAVAVNGSPFDWKDNANAFTSTFMKLPAPLAPHDSVQLRFTWHYEISEQSNREGMLDPTTYFLAYFYPRVGVFDDYNGWDRMNFMDSHEFYSDFNDYSVTINVPKNYVVWGTGTLQHPEKLLQPDVLARYRESLTSDQVLHIATKEDHQAARVTTQNATNSWQFTATKIPDMTFALSDHYLWDGGSQLVDKTTQRKASVQSAYLEGASDFVYMVKFAKHALAWLSAEWPGVPYPYEKTTVVQGFADMEYPMMVNDSSFPDTTFARFVVEHEIAHTYMPFYMGINETRYGFMDEGWATTFELLIGRADMGPAADELYKRFRVGDWINDRASNEDIAIITPGDAMTGNGFGNNEYGKASLGYLAMKDLLGDEAFRKCLRTYMARWNGKHPTPWDFFYTFNNVSAKNLNWFWTAWYFTNGYIDLGIGSVKKSGEGFSVVVNNTGGMPAPFDLVATYADGTTERFHQTPAVWESNLKTTTVVVKTRSGVKTLTLDGGIWMDANPKDNVWENK